MGVVMVVSEAHREISGFVSGYFRISVRKLMASESEIILSKRGQVS
jgi:hypothetical protein